jgi:hypothetical protein
MRLLQIHEHAPVPRSGNLHIASVSGVIAPARCAWTPPWSENPSRNAPRIGLSLHLCRLIRTRPRSTGATCSSGASTTIGGQSTNTGPCVDADLNATGEIVDSPRQPLSNCAGNAWKTLRLSFNLDIGEALVLQFRDAHDPGRHRGHALVQLFLRKPYLRAGDVAEFELHALDRA